MNQAIENLKAVLCNPEGKCCIEGSDEDRRIVDEALAILSAKTRPAPDAENVGVEWNGKFSASGGIRLAWGCSINDAVEDVLKSIEPDDNRRRELAYQITTKARDRFEKTPAHKILDELGAKDIIAAPKGMKWQPIKTAPRDGTYIITFDEKSNRFRVDYCDISDEEEPFLGNPTHWMPLPAPPSADAVKSAEGGER